MFSDDTPLWLTVAALAAAGFVATFASRWYAIHRRTAALRCAEALASPDKAIRGLALEAFPRLARGNLRSPMIEVLSDHISRQLGRVEGTYEAGIALDVLGRIRGRHVGALAFSGGSAFIQLWDGGSLGKMVFTDCRFTGWFCAKDLRETVFRRCTFEDTEFRQCDLRGAQFEGCTLSSVVLTGCRLGMLTMKDCTASNVTSDSPVALSGESSGTVAALPPGGIAARLGRRLRGPFWSFAHPRRLFAAVVVVVLALQVADFVHSAGWRTAADMADALNSGHLLEFIRQDHVLDTGNEAYQAKRYEDAALDYATYIRLHPRDPGGFFNLGLAQLATNRFDEAVQNFDRAERRGEPVAKVAAPRAEAKCRAGNASAAQDDLKRLQEAGSAYAPSLQALCQGSSSKSLPAP